MNADIVKLLDARNAKKELPSFKVGDIVDVHVKIKEGEKERIQLFNGTVIKVKGGRGIRGTFTVRRIVQGEGVERVFPFHSPAVEDVVVKRAGKVRRSKLYYLRGRIGKATKVKERREDERPGEEARATGPGAGKKLAAAPVEETVAT
jgi:large subunit ribosomal protein L19